MADKSLNLGTIFTAEATQFFSTITKMKTALKTLNSAYAQTGTAAKKGLGTIAPAIDKTSKSFDKGGKKAQEYSKQIGKVTGAFKRTVAAMKVTASYGIAATAIFAVTNAFKAGIKEIVDYDQALKNLQAITRATDAEVTGMGETIKQVAETTKFSTGEVADGMVLLGQAGFSASEAMNAMQAVANLATGTLGNMQTVTDLLTTTIRAFNLDTIESSRVSDVMANAINRSKLTIDKLRIAFNFVGAAASQSGLSIEELSASMMLLANNGLRASTIGTGLRQVLARLLAPNRRLREEFQAQGIALDKINPRTVGYQNAMKELTKVLFDAETQTVDMGKAYQLFGLRGAQAVSVLVKGFAGTGFQNMLDKTYEVGTASDMAAKQMEGLGVAFKNLMDRAKLLFVVLGEGGLTHTLKVFVLILKNATIAMAVFLKSGIGQLIISFGALTGSVYLLLKGLGLLIPQIVRLGKVMIAARIASSSWIASYINLRKHMTRTTAASIMLGTSIAKLAHPYLAAAMAIGIIVAAINHYLGRTQRAIDATVKMSQETSNNVHALKVYGEAIENINKKKEQGQKVDEEYSAVLQRLLETYPELKDKIKLTTDAHEENARVIKDVLGKELDKTIEQNTELLLLYDKQAKQARILHGMWLAIKGLNPFEGILEGIASSYDKMTMTNREMGKSGKLAKSYFEKLGEGSKEVTEAEKQRLKVLEDTSKVMEKADKSVKTIVRTLEEMGATAPEIRKIGKSFADNAIKIKEMEKALEETRGGSEHRYKEYYKNLDVMRKADFLKTIKAMDDEIAAAKKKHDDLKTGTKLGYDVIAAIRTKHLMKFEEDSYKEILSAEEISRRKIEAVENEIQRTKELYDAETIEIHNRYQEELEAAEGNKEKMLEAEETFNEKIVEQAKERAESIEGIQKEHNKEVLKEQKKVVDEMRKAHTKMAEDLIDKLKSKYKDLKSEVENLMSDLRNMEIKYEEDIRQLKQGEMTEEKKWEDDKYEYHRLMNEGKKTGDIEYYEKAFELAKELSREVKDAEGEIVQTKKSTQETAIIYAKDAYKAMKELSKKTIADKREEMKVAKESLDEVMSKLEEYQVAIGRANEEELRLDLVETLRRLGEANNIIIDFSKKWDLLKSKTITLTVKIDKPKGSFDTGPTEVPDTPTPERKGGFIERLTRGKKLPGFGGGDKIRALLEAGEWVINKEAVQKYGSSLFKALNDMSFNIEDLLGGAMKRMGGMIPQPAPVKYQSGGEVGAVSSAGAGNTYQITFAPQFMTGDEMAMRAMAPELKRILEDLDHRWGK